MIKKICSLFIIISATVIHSWGQTSIEDKVTEVYGSYTSSIPPTQYAWIENCYERCQVIIESELPEGAVIQQLNDVSIVNKYGTTLTHDTEYNPSTFNPLKYMFNFHEKYDQYYRIGATSYIIKINKKEG